MIAAACLLLANLYYAQPILPEIASAIRLPRDASGAVVTASQLGYIVGLLFLAPLGDIVENRKLCGTMAAGAGCAVLAAASAQAAPLLGLAFLMGVFASATQVLVVFAVTLEGASRSGKILGIMACGLFLGIAMSRPLSSFVTELADWRFVYLGSGVALLGVALALWRCLPGRQPGKIKETYGAFLKGMAAMTRFPGLIRRTLISSGAFFSMTMFWSCMPMYLADTLRCPQKTITLFTLMFTLMGLVTPPCMLVVGRLLDKGIGLKITLAALSGALLAWGMLSLLPGSLGISITAALLLDPASNAVTVSVQQTLLSASPPETRGRLNSLNISMNFLGGAAGATAGPWLLTRYGLGPVLLTGLLLLLILLGAALLENRKRASTRSDG